VLFVLCCFYFFFWGREPPTDLKPPNPFFESSFDPSRTWKVSAPSCFSAGLRQLARTTSTLLVPSNGSHTLYLEWSFAVFTIFPRYHRSLSSANFTSHRSLGFHLFLLCCWFWGGVRSKTQAKTKQSKTKSRKKPNQTKQKNAPYSFSFLSLKSQNLQERDKVLLFEHVSL